MWGQDFVTLALTGKDHRAFLQAILTANIYQEGYVISAVLNAQGRFLGDCCLKYFENTQGFTGKTSLSPKNLEQSSLRVLPETLRNEQESGNNGEDGSNSQAQNQTNFITVAAETTFLTLHNSFVSNISKMLNIYKIGRQVQITTTPYLLSDVDLGKSYWRNFSLQDFFSLKALISEESLVGQIGGKSLSLGYLLNKVVPSNYVLPESLDLGLGSCDSNFTSSVLILVCALLKIPLGFKDLIVGKSVILEYNLDYLIDFTKGCYVGQELMARVKYLGEVRKQLQTLLLIDGIYYQANLTAMQLRAIKSPINDNPNITWSSLTISGVIEDILKLFGMKVNESVSVALVALRV